MLTRTRFAAIWLVVVAILAANPADARPSGSFRSGFSSGKSTAARNIGAPRQPAFGSFGKRQSPPPAAARTPQRESAMSRDLDRKAAQEQALRTYDARRYAGSAAPAGGATAATAAGGAAPPLPPLNPVLPGGSNGGGFGNGRSAGSQPNSVPGGATSAAAPVIVRDSSNGWLWGIGGFMLGRAADGHAAPPPAAQPAPAAQPGTPANNGAMAEAAGASDISAEGNTAGTDAARAVPAPAAKPAASEAGIIAKLAVLLLFCGMAWLVWKAFRLMAGAQAVKKHVNYSFERN